jgi:hypothetical protein
VLGGGLIMDKYERLANWLREKGTIVLKADDRRDFQVTFYKELSPIVKIPEVEFYPWREIEEHAQREDTSIWIYEADHGACHLYAK